MGLVSEKLFSLPKAEQFIRAPKVAAPALRLAPENMGLALVLVVGLVEVGPFILSACNYKYYLRTEQQINKEPATQNQTSQKVFSFASLLSVS